MNAYVRAENKPMLKVFEHQNFVRRPSETPREVYLELDLWAERAASGEGRAATG